MAQPPQIALTRSEDHIHLVHNDVNRLSISSKSPDSSSTESTVERSSTAPILQHPSSSPNSPMTPAHHESVGLLVSPDNNNNGWRSNSPSDPSRPISRSMSSGYVPSPLGPSNGGPPQVPWTRNSRPASSASRPGSILLYRLASDGSGHDLNNGPYSTLAPPVAFPGGGRPSRFSTISTAGSVFSLSSDSKYPVPYSSDPSAPTPTTGAFLPYEYDPAQDQDAPPDADDALHEPDPKGTRRSIGSFNLRGLLNVIVLIIIIIALLALFISYPVITYFETHDRTARLLNNAFTNGTGQIDTGTGARELVDRDTPRSAHKRTGFDGFEYDIVFSDEFNKDGRRFGAGADSYWEAASVFPPNASALEYFSTNQVTTRDGHLVITMEQAPQGGKTFRTGMIQSWNKFCFSAGYIELSVSLPTTSGLSANARLVGNLARPHFAASMDGVWPYSYNSCDIGTHRNQTDLAGGPDAAYTGGDPTANYQLSILPGQRLSACTCGGGEHPGPNTRTGRGAPEIDIFQGAAGQVSQSAKVAPMAEAYAYPQTAVEIHGASTSLNPVLGSATAQSISAISSVTNGDFSVFATEFWSDPDHPSDGVIHWAADGNRVFTMTAAALPEDTGAQISQRLVSVEPMAITIDLMLAESGTSVSLTQSAELLVDYIRVYQRKDLQNIGCNPRDHPTESYIQAHSNAYTDGSLASWTDAGYAFPGNSGVNTC